MFDVCCQKIGFLLTLFGQGGPQVTEIENQQILFLIDGKNNGLLFIIILGIRKEGRRMLGRNYSPLR